MNTPPQVWLAWSTGKESAFALHELRKQPGISVTGLFTTVAGEPSRAYLDLVRRQGEAAGLPVEIVPLPQGCTNEEYERQLRALAAKARASGVSYLAFGDVFQDDIRAYRERLLAGTGVDPLFPLWQRPTDRLAREMLAAGFKAVITSVDPGRLSFTFAGSRFDEDFLALLPAGVDPCGERGEFHTFVTDAPVFRQPIPVRVGETEFRDGLVTSELLPSEASSATAHAM